MEEYDVTEGIQPLFFLFFNGNEGEAPMADDTTSCFNPTCRLTGQNLRQFIRILWE